MNNNYTHLVFTCEDINSGLLPVTLTPGVLFLHMHTQLSPYTLAARCRHHLTYAHVCKGQSSIMIMVSRKRFE